MDIDPRTISRWCDVSAFIKQGQQQTYLRCEGHNLPCNTIPVPAEVLLRSGRLRRNKANQGDEYPWKAWIEANGGRRVVAEAATKRELDKDLSFALNYSQYAESAWYRCFRTLYGFDEGSHNYRTPEQQAESEDRTFRIFAVMAGVGGV